MAMKKGLILVAMTLLLTVFGPLASVSANDYAQQLVDAIKAMDMADDQEVSYLYSHLQTAGITEAEFQSILANAEDAEALVAGLEHPEDLTSAQRNDLAALLNDSAQKAHLNIKLVNESGAEVAITDLTGADFSALTMSVTDLDGTELVSYDPSMDDFQAGVISSRIAALGDAAEAAVELEAEAQFVPMPGQTLPDTATETPLYMAIGLGLLLFGLVSIYPAVKVARKF